MRKKEIMKIFLIGVLIIILVIVFFCLLRRLTCTDNYQQNHHKMTNKILFILFPGDNIHKIQWTINIADGSKSNFLEELKKLGDVYTYTPNVYKFDYYANKTLIPPKEREILTKYGYFEKPTKLTLDQFNVDKECKRIYEEVKFHNGPFIPLGHSGGGIFAYHFSRLYPNRCSKLVLIEEQRLLYRFRLQKTLYPSQQFPTFPNLTNDQLQELENNIKTKQDNGKYISKINDIVLYEYTKFMQNSNGKLILPTLSFQGLRLTTSSGLPKDFNNNYNELYIKEYENAMEKINGNKVTYINFIDTNHFPWYIPYYSNEMIKQIKCLINK